MSSIFPSKLIMTEANWRALILSVSSIVLLITIFCLSQGITVIFMHLYYIPIILLAYRYQRSGFWAILLLSLLYLVLVAAFLPGDIIAIQAAAARIFLFVGVGVLGIFISENLVKSRADFEFIRQIHQNVIQNANVWMMILDNTGIVLEWNSAAEKLSGYSSREVKGESDIWKRLYPDREYRKEVSRQINEIISKRSYLENFSTAITTKDGREKTILWNTRELPRTGKDSPLYIGVGVDITDQKEAEDRIRLQAIRTQKLLELNRMKDAPFSEMLAFSLEACLRMTKSRYSFIGMMNSDESIISIRSWSRDVMEECAITDKALDFPISSTGVLGECVRRRTPFILNDYSAPHPAKHGCPEGHVPINRFLSIPLFDGERIVAVIAVANKVDNYDVDDIDALATLGNHLWELLHRREAEDALHDSEERYRAFFNTSRDCVFITTVDGLFIDFNEEAVGLLGYENREDLMGRPVTDVYADPDERSQHIAFISEHGYSKEYPVRLRKKDGTIIDTLVTTVAVRDEKGNIIRFQGTIRDITEQKHAVDALRRSEEKFRDIFDKANDAIEIFKMDRHGKPGKYIDVNEVAAQMLGYTKEEVLQHSPLDFDITDYEKPPYNEIYRELQSGGSVKFETGHRKKDGSVLPVEVNIHIITLLGERVGLSIVRDITERKLAEEALHESEEKFRGVAERSSDLIILTDPDGIATYVSPSVTRILGFPPEEIVGKKPLDFILPDDLEAVYKGLQKNLEGIPTANIEVRIRKKDGSYAIMDISGSAVVEEDRIAGVQVIGRDVTERKKAEHKIKDLNSLLRSIRDVNQLVVQEHDLQALMQGACDILRQTRDYQNIEIALMDDATGTIRPVANSGVYSRRDWKLDLNGKGNASKCIRECLKNRQTILVTDPGSYCTGCDYFKEHAKHDTLIIPILQKKRIVGILSTALLPRHEISQDEITLLEEIAGDLGHARGKYQAEKALTESEEKFRLYIENAPIGVFITDNQGRWLDVNPAASSITGYSSEELMNMRISDVLPPQVLDEAMEHFQKLVETGQDSIETMFVNKSGEMRYWTVDAVRISQDRLLGLAQDITERKLAEAERDRLASVVRHSSELIALTTPERKVIFINEAGAEMIGIRPEDSANHDLMEFIPDHQKELMLNEVLPALVEHGRWEGDLQYQNLKTGGLVDTHAMTFMITDPVTGAPQFLANVSLDITKRKQAEDALRKSKHRSATLLEAIPDMMFVLSRDGVYLDFSVPDKNLLAVPADQIIGKSIRDAGFEKENVDIILQYIGLAIERRELQKFEYELFIGGKKRLYEARLVALSKNEVLGIVRDITERRRAEEALRESEQKFREIFDNINDGIEIIEINEDGNPGRFIDLNAVACLTLQYSKEELLGMGPLDIDTQNFSQPFEEIMNEIFTIGHGTFQTEHRKKDGTVFPVEINTHMVTILGKKVILSVVRDITERKQAEAALRESQQLFSDIISFLPDPTFVIDKEGKVLAWNRALEILSGIPAGDIIGKGDYGYSIWAYGERRPILIDLVLQPDMDYTSVKYKDYHRDGMTVTAEAEITRPDGNMITLSLVASPLIDPDGEITGAIESMRDITRIKETEDELALLNENLEQMVKDRTKELEEEVVARKKAEETIRASLDEKVVLLREIHHRVKNNFQIIISLMNLQMRKAKDPGLKELLQETQDRIRAMSLVHEKLYRSEDLSRIDLSSYLKSLVMQLFASHGEVERKVTLHMEFDRIITDINTAIPLGLAINELVSNALKHAFPGDNTGNITIRGRVTDGEINVSVKDDGIGFPAGFDWRETPTLGLHLVLTLIRQLNGRIEKLETPTGTTFAIIVPAEKGGGKV
jgi:PAS domain S-box-containing protein